MGKSVIVAYILWACGGWYGLHHFYLGRDRQAFVWLCFFAGYGGIGWFSDLFRIPGFNWVFNKKYTGFFFTCACGSYVNEANLEESYLLQLTESIKRHRKPPFSLYRFMGQIIFGNLLAWVTSRAVPEEPVAGYSLHWLHILIPLGSAIGVHVVGNIGREKGALKPALIGAYLPYLFYTYDNPRYYISSFLAAAAFRRYTQWNRQPPKRRHICRRIAVLGTSFLIYMSLWGSFFYFNLEMTNEHGEPIKFRDSIINLLNSKMWKQLSDSLSTLWQYYRIHGFSSLWNEVLGHLDPMGERNALAILELPSSATQEQITKKWRQLSRQYHPDKFSDPVEKAAAQAKFMEIKEAYDKISVINSKRKRKSSRSDREL